MVKSSQEEKKICLAQLQKHMKNKLPENGPENSYCQKFSSLKDCVVSSQPMKLLFKSLGNSCGTCFEVEGYEDIIAAYESGYVEMDTWKEL